MTVLVPLWTSRLWGRRSTKRRMEENYPMNPVKRFTFLLTAAVVALPLALTGCPKSAEELVEDSTEDVQLQQDMMQDQETAAQNEAAQDEGAMEGMPGGQ